MKRRISIGALSLGALFTIQLHADAPLDFNGDNFTDYSIHRTVQFGTQHRWFWAFNGVAGGGELDWGQSGDTFVMEDFDGDGKDDVTVWRAGAGANSAFFIFQSQTSTVRIENFGIIDDDATVVGDYDGDNKADLAVYRAGSPSRWFYRGTLNNPSGNITSVVWGQTGDKVGPGDYDGDGKNDFVIRREGIWWERMATGAVVVQSFGLSSDFIVPGDYDGDNKTDLTAFRNPGIGSFTWYILPSGGGSVQIFTWGTVGTDSPVQGDYDGDGKTDIAIWRTGSPSTFWSRNSSNGATRVFAFGNSTDAPIGAFNRH